MKLQYKAATQDRKFQQGIIEARNIDEAVRYIREKGMIPITVKKESSEVFSLPSFLKRRGDDVVLFTRQLSSMLSSGLTLMQALNILHTQIQNQDFRDAIQDIIGEVQEGKTFSQALAAHPELFSPIYLSLVSAGESSGLMDTILDRLARNLEKSQKLRSTVISALFYPAIIIILMTVVVIVMMIFVIPQLTTLYSNLNISLPLPTVIVIDLSNFVINFWPLVIGIIVFLIFGYNRWSATDSGKLIIDEVSLKLPITGKLISYSLLTEITRTLSLLIGSGALVVQALIKTASVSNNKIFQIALEDVARRVEKGVSVGDALSVYGIFPPMLVQMTHIGEQTGKLDESLMKAAEYFEREVENSVKGLTAALEPVIMVVLGLGVAFLIVSIITPIYNLTSSIQ